MSYAIAANSIPKFSTVNGDEKRNFNMPDELKTPGGAVTPWPAHEKANAPGDWMHSDFKDVSLQFVHPMYKKMIDLGKLDEN